TPALIPSFVNLRIGPYVCAEWTYGGVPVWLGLKPGMRLRSSEGPWQAAMQGWFQRVVDVARPFFAARGGPIVMVQVENELHGDDMAYVDWCGRMAHTTLTSAGVWVPILMCNGNSSPLTINTCNGFDCVDFIESHGQSGAIGVSQPPLWTEDEAYHTLRWFARGGSHVNYYMWTGGNNVGHWAGAGITNAYSLDAPLCPDLLPHPTKAAHFTAMHSTLAHIAPVLLAAPAQTGKQFTVPYFDGKAFVNGTQQLGWRYPSEQGHGGVVFLENQFMGGELYVLYGGRKYPMQPQSVLVVDEASGNVLFDTADVQTPATHRVSSPCPDCLGAWQAWQEPVLGGPPLPNVTSSTPLEQGNASVQLGDAAFNAFMLYDVDVALPQASEGFPLTVSAWSSVGLTAWLNGSVVGVAADATHDGSTKTYTIPCPSSSASAPGTARLTILSQSLGYNNFFPS
ncbi:BGAL5, partial [Symbiodinium sp. KB8]